MGAGEEQSFYGHKVWWCDEANDWYTYMHTHVCVSVFVEVGGIGFKLLQRAPALAT